MLIRLHIEGGVERARSRGHGYAARKPSAASVAAQARSTSARRITSTSCEGVIADVQRQKGSKAAFRRAALVSRLLGMINWIYQWYKPEGRLQAQDLIPQYTEMLFAGAFLVVESGFDDSHAYYPVLQNQTLYETLTKER